MSEGWWSKMSTTGERELWRADAEGGDQGETGAAFDLFGGLSIQLGRLNDHMDHERRRLERRKRLVPMDFDASAAGNFPAAGVLVLPLGQPSQGRIWEVRNWSCGGVTWGTVATGSATLGGTGAYGKLQGGGQGVGGNTAPPTQEVQDAFATLPNVRQIGTRQLVVNSGETLCAVVSGGAVGQQYVAHAYVIDYPLDAELFAPGGGI